MTARSRAKPKAGAKAGAGAGASAGARAKAKPAESAFDALYAEHARSLTRQAYLLCAHRHIAEHAVTHAFHLAWERWPEVAADPDPAGWVRAAAYEYALSPWHQLHPGCRHHQPHPGPPADRAMVDGLRRLPRSYRWALLLHDGLGLSVADTAAETEASTAATFGRVAHAREALAEMVPELRQAPVARRPELIAERLTLLADAQPARTLPPRLVRTGSEQTTRRRTRAAVGLTVLIAAATAVSWAASDDRASTPPVRHAPALPGLAGTRERAGEAYAPLLRSSNERMRLTEDGEVEVTGEGEGGAGDPQHTRDGGARDGDGDGGDRGPSEYSEPADQGRHLDHGRPEPHSEHGPHRPAR